MRSHTGKGRPGGLMRLLRICFTVYLWISVGYTALVWLVFPAWNAVVPPKYDSSLITWLPAALHASNATATAPSIPTGQAGQPGTQPDPAALQQNQDAQLQDDPSHEQKEEEEQAADALLKQVSILPQTPWHQDSLAWHPPTHSLAHKGSNNGLSYAAQLEDLLDSNANGIAMSEDFFLGKAFGESLQPSKVIPYYYRASQQPQQEDITITTLITQNRFKVFADTVERYKGPISVTIHVPEGPERAELLQSLDELYTTAPYMSTYVDVHLVIDSFERQFNMWRNVARFFARTDYVMMLDVDFWLCTDFRQRMLNSPDIMARLREGNAAFVVPAFEFNDQEDGIDSSTFPSNKADLMKLVEDSKIDMFHKAWQPGHGSTNYTRFYEAQPGDVYKVHGYTHSYEPYAIFKKEGTPYCDERFIGYGGNKAACLYELYLSGVSYYVLPDDFLIHQSHAYAEKARQHERRYNRKLYTDFREELCFRYLSQFLDTREIDTQKSKNMQTECKKIKGFYGAAKQMIQAQVEQQKQIAGQDPLEANVQR